MIAKVVKIWSNSSDRCEEKWERKEGGSPKNEQALAAIVRMRRK